MLQFRKASKNLKSNLFGLNGPSKKRLFYVKQKARIYRINVVCRFLLATAVKQVVPILVLWKQGA